MPCGYNNLLTIAAKYHGKARIAVCLLVIWLPGCANPQESVPVMPSYEISPQLYLPVLEEEYRIGVGDNLSIRSYTDPQVNQDLLVRPDGRISVLMIGDILVVGMTPTELGEYVTEEYRKRIRAPDITIIITEIASSEVYVGGEVKAPSLVRIRGGLSVVHAITASGGFLASADKTQVLLLRAKREGRVQVSKIDVGQILANQSPDLYLRRNDIVYVPKTGIAELGTLVDLYINNLIPDAILLNFGFITNLDDQTVTVPSVPPP